MLEILRMNKEQLLKLDYRQIDRKLTPEEIVHIAKKLDAFWEFDYQAAKEGRPGKHALLKSELHSDGFFVSRILLESWNMRMIMAVQMGLRFHDLRIPRPECIAGIPDGATELGKEVARFLSVKIAEMKKENGKISLVSAIAPDETLLLVEDFCTRGTGFVEAVNDIISKQPKVKILPYELVIINRGGLTEIPIAGMGAFKIIAVAEHRINDWQPSECPLCKMGSVSIKPKATDENWRDITTSQLLTV
jgi:orotate phosphoribosyltransferase